MGTEVGLVPPTTGVTAGFSAIESPEGNLLMSAVGSGDSDRSSVGGDVAGAGVGLSFGVGSDDNAVGSNIECNSSQYGPLFVSSKHSHCAGDTE